MSSIATFVRERDIQEIVHFTTQKGLLGMCFTHAVLPRNALREEQMLEFMVKINAAERKDVRWFGHVNLSINEINRRFFAAANRWHGGLWWVILSFSPEILTHDNVNFATTNLAYNAAASNHGASALKALYGESVAHFRGQGGHAKRDAPHRNPTCPQAEVLYPGRLGTQFLRRVYVKDAANYREACSFLTFLPNRAAVDVAIDPDRFSPHKVDPCARRW